MGYPQMATIRHGVVQIIMKCLYFSQINSDLYETLNLSSGVSTYYTNLSDPHGQTPNGCYKTWGSSKYQEMSLSLTKQLGYCTTQSQPSPALPNHNLGARVCTNLLILIYSLLLSLCTTTTTIQVSILLRQLHSSTIN